MAISFDRISIRVYLLKSAVILFPCSPYKFPNCLNELSDIHHSNAAAARPASVIGQNLKCVFCTYAEWTTKLHLL